MNELELIFATEKTILNFIEKETKSFSSSLTSFSKNKDTEHTSKYKLKAKGSKSSAKAKGRSAKRKAKNSKDKSSALFDLNSLLPSFADLLTLDANKIMSMFSNVINSFISSGLQALTSLISNFSGKAISDLISKIGSGFSSAIAGISSKISELLGSFTSSITALGSSLVSGFSSKIQGLLKTDISSIMSLGTKLPDLPKLPGLDANKIKENFQKRKTGESSTSKYIQAKVPNAKGGVKKNSGVLSETPDAKIITPLLKKDTNVVKTFKSPAELLAKAKNITPEDLSAVGSKLAATLPISKITKELETKIKSVLPDTSALKSLSSKMDSKGNIKDKSSSKGSKTKDLQKSVPSLDKVKVSDPKKPVETKLTETSDKETKSLVDMVAKPGAGPPALVPAEEKKEVKEEKPSGDKAEYGKIQVKENKAGYVEISDETPGNVRKVDLHPSGSYNSKLDNGDAHQKTVGDRVDITEKDWKVTVMQNAIIIVYNDTKIEIRNDKVENIKGNCHTNIDGETKTKVAKDVTNNYDSNFNEKIGQNSNIAIGGNEDKKISGNLTETISGNHKEAVTGNLTINVTGNVNITGNNINCTAKSQVVISAPKIMLG